VFAWLIGTGHWTRALSGSAGLWIVAYFILGYFFYAAVFGALGAVFTSEYEIQPIQSVLSIAGVIPIALAVLVLDEPDSTMVRVLSYIPFVTPTIMVLRIAVADPSLLERCLAAFTLLAGGAVMMKIAASLFELSARFQRIRRPT
jgi:ABC-2 type transport system permease protein